MRSLVITFVASFLLFANANASSEREFTCDGFKVNLIIPEGTQAFGTISPERGLWFEVPNMDISSDDERVFFLNADNNKLALFGIGNTGKLYLQIYRSYEHYQAGQPTHTLRCRKG